jgi:hypothetical protein
MSNYFLESSEKLLHALLITQISKEDYRDSWTFSRISSGFLNIWKRDLFKKNLIGDRVITM